MYFRLPLQVREFVHLVGPDRRIQFEAAGDGDHFLAVGHAARPDYARYSYAFGFAQMFTGELRAATRATGRFGGDAVEADATGREPIGFADVAAEVVLRVATEAVFGS